MKEVTTRVILMALALMAFAIAPGASIAQPKPTDGFLPKQMYDYLDVPIKREIESGETVPGLVGKGSSWDIPETLKEEEAEGSAAGLRASIIGDGGTETDYLKLGILPNPENISASNPNIGYSETLLSDLTGERGAFNSSKHIALSAIGLSDPMVYDSLVKTQELTENTYQSILQSEEVYIRQLKDCGTSECLTRLTAYQSCKKSATEQRNSSSGEPPNKIETILLCLRSGLENGAGQGPGIRAARAGVPGASTVNARASFWGIDFTMPSMDDFKKMLENFGDALMEQAASQCQLNNLEQYDKAELCFPTEEEDFQTVDGALVGVGIRLSSLMWGKDAGLSAEQLAAKTEWKEVQGDMCYFCGAGGGQDPAGVASVYKFPIAPSRPGGRAAMYTKIESKVYDVLRELMYDRCYKDNANLGPQAATQSVAGVLRLQGESGTLPGCFNDGQYWSHCDTKLWTIQSEGRQVPIEEVLESLSFPGFDMTPPLLNSVYNLLTDKNKIAERSQQNGGGWENSMCEWRFGRGADHRYSYQNVKAALGDRALGATPADRVFIPREIKALFFMARKIALGKAYGAGDSIVNAIARETRGNSEYAADAMTLVAQGLGVQTIEDYRGAHGRNLVELLEFVERLDRLQAENSGKSGSSMAKAFYGKNSESQR